MSTYIVSREAIPSISSLTAQGYLSSAKANGPRPSMEAEASSRSMHQTPIIAGMTPISDDAEHLRKSDPTETHCLSVAAFGLARHPARFRISTIPLCRTTRTGRPDRLRAQPKWWIHPPARTQRPRQESATHRARTNQREEATPIQTMRNTSLQLPKSANGSLVWLGPSEQERSSGRHRESASRAFGLPRSGLPEHTAWPTSRLPGHPSLPSKGVKWAFELPIRRGIGGIL